MSETATQTKTKTQVSSSRHTARAPLGCQPSTWASPNLSGWLQPDLHLWSLGCSGSSSFGISNLCQLKVHTASKWSSQMLDWFGPWLFWSIFGTSISGLEAWTNLCTHKAQPHGHVEKITLGRDSVHFSDPMFKVGYHSYPLLTAPFPSKSWISAWTDVPLA